MKRKEKLRILKSKAKKQQKRQNSDDITERVKPKPAADERFESVSYDPRFMKVPKSISKVKIDKRFSRMMTDDRFKFVSSVDKYGRKIQTSQQNQQLKDFYYEEGEEGMEQQPMDQQLSKPKGHDRNIRQWMENYDQESSETDSQIEYDEQQEKELWEEDTQNVLKSKDVKVTKRMALCNYDWMSISAKDLMILFTSFKPTLGSVVSVTVYPSDIGLKRMKEEEKYGPQGIWLKQQQHEESLKKPSGRSLKNILEGAKDKQNSLDTNKLREYEKERLKYFYAVIEFDSMKTAEQIYKTCDGKQFENAGLLDLRYVPDELVFPHQPHDYCDELPSKGTVKNYVNRALGHSKINLTWQDPELNTLAGLKKNNWNKMTDKQLQNIDWSLYLNDDGMSEDENKEQVEEVSVEHDVLPQWKKSMRKEMRNQQNQDEIMEIRFESGFDLAKKIKDKQQEKNMTSFELYKKKKKEKKAEKQEEKKRRKEQEQQMAPPQRDCNYHFNSDEKERQHLQLLVDKRANKQEFKPDVQDKRFLAVHSNPLYSIDPTSHHFKVTKNTKLLGEVVRRKRNTAQ